MCHQLKEVGEREPNWKCIPACCLILHWHYFLSEVNCDLKGEKMYTIFSLYWVFVSGGKNASVLPVNYSTFICMEWSMLFLVIYTKHQQSNFLKNKKKKKNKNTVVLRHLCLHLLFTDEQVWLQTKVGIFLLASRRELNTWRYMNVYWIEKFDSPSPFYLVSKKVMKVTNLA